VVANAARDTVASVKVSVADAAGGRADILVSREQAVKARARIEKEIARQAPGTPIELDFRGVRAISIGFADECVGRIVSSRLAGYDEDHPILVSNGTEEVRETLAAALRQRRLSLLALGPEGPELLGGDEIMSSTLREALELESFTVNELKDRLGLTVQAANNRLTQLVRVGALTRSRIVPSRGGREFRYEVPGPARAAGQPRRRRAPARA
jgi:STAS-like domain of unknown function (DUF4325)